MDFKNDVCFLESLAQEHGNIKIFSTFFLFPSSRSSVAPKNKAREHGNRLRLSRFLRSYNPVPVPGPWGDKKRRGPTQTLSASHSNRRTNDDPYSSSALNRGSGDSMVDHR